MDNNWKVSLRNVMVDDEFDRDVLEQNGLQRVNTLLNVMGVDE